MAFDFNKIKEENTPGKKANLEKLAGELADMNYKSFTESEDYASLAKRYSQYGQKAMDDTIGKVAARTGGLASSYATAAGNQAYNDYMGRLEDAARSVYDSQRQEKLDNLGVSQSLYQQNYQEKRDGVADYQWRQQFDASNSQWDQQFNYTKDKDEKNQLLQDAQAIWMTGGTLTDDQLLKLGMDRQTEAAYKTYYESKGNDEPKYITDPEQVELWSDLILEAKTESEARAYAQNLYYIDKDLSFSLFEQWQLKHPDE